MSADATPPKCVVCSGMDNSHVMKEALVKDHISKTIPGWSVGSNEEASLFLTRRFIARNFQCALDCLNEMGAIAEKEQHHPNFHLTNYRELQVDIWTHKLGGVTQSDIDLARLLDSSVKIDYSPKWLRENPVAKSTSKNEPSSA